MKTYIEVDPVMELPTEDGEYLTSAGRLLFKRDGGMTTEEYNALAEMFKPGREPQMGFILIPDMHGFKVFEIEKERLESYLMAESMYRKNKEG